MTHPGGRAEQRVEVPRVRPGAVRPSPDEARVGPQHPCEPPPGQPGGLPQGLEPPRKVRWELLPGPSRRSTAGVP